MNRKGVYFFLARRAVHKKKWSKAKQHYEKVLPLVSNKYNDVGFKNEATMNISVIDRLMNLEDYRQQVQKYNDDKGKASLRVAVVSAVSGGYDSLKLPAKLESDFDYIFYTDTPVRPSGVFEIRPMPYFSSDTTRMARYIKTNLHTLITGYDVVIWVDANIMLLDEIKPDLENFLKSKKAVGAIPHPLRKSVYREGRACMKLGKDDVDVIQRQLKHYRKENYNCRDLIESGFMMFDMRHPKINQFFSRWWSEIDKYSRRDQLSLNYALDTTGIKWHRLMEKPYDARTYPKFALVPHRARQTAILNLEAALGSKETDPYAGDSFTKHKDAIIAAELHRRVDVVYCVHNALEDVKICLASVVKHRKNPNLRLIIIDDGSDTPTKKYLEKFHAAHPDWTELHRKETGSGYTKAANRGLKAARGDLVILLNSDTVTTDGWTEKMSHAVFSTPGAGIVGPLSSAASSQSIPDTKSKDQQTAVNSLPNGVTVDDMNRLCESWTAANFYPRVTLVHGFCFGITREALDKIGYFDEDSFPRGYGEENDYCFRAANAGVGLVLATNTYIYHAKSKSYQSEQRIKNMNDGRTRLKELHGEERIRRAVLSMENNPALVRMRARAGELYK